MQKLKQNKWILILLFIFAILLILATPIERSLNGNLLTPGEETYHHLNNIEGGTTNFYELIISNLLNFIPLTILIIVLPLILMLLSLTLFYSIIIDYVKSELELYFAMGIFILTPVFLTIHIGLILYSLLLCLTLMIVHFYKLKSKLFLLFLLLIYFLSPFIGLILILFLLLDAGAKKTKLNLFILLGFIGLIVVLGFFIPNIYLQFSSLQFLFKPNQLFNFLGGKYGFVLFSFVLGLLGLYSDKDAILNLGQRLMMTIILFVSFFYEPLRVLLIPFLSFFAANYLTKLINKKWAVFYLKEVTIILFICMLLFSTISEIQGANAENPTLNQKEAYSFLYLVKDQNPEVSSAKLLTNPAYGEQATYFSKIEAYSFLDDAQSILFTKHLMKSRDYAFIKERLQQEKIAFIYVDDLMLNGNILDKQDQGILFVMDNNDNFKLIYSKNKEKIYYFTLWNYSDTLS